MLGKVAIVTDSSNGIGRATAVLLASKGAKVVITGRNSETLEQTFEEILKRGRSTPNDILKVGGDLLEKEFVEELVKKTVDPFGKIDILNNNAGQIYVDTTGKEGFDQSIEILQQNIEANVKAPMYLSQLFFQHLKDTKGSIVFNSTFLALAPHGVISMPYYAISKATLDHTARAMEYIKSGVRVNMVNPGLISTTFFNRFGVSMENVHKMEDYCASHPTWIPPGRVGTPEDFANAMVFLADKYPKLHPLITKSFSSQSSYIVMSS